MEKLKIEYWDIERLQPYARNPRKNDEAVPRMAGLIREFGFRVPVIIRSSGEVIDGHLRLKAAWSLGMTQVPVVIADDWSEAQVKAFRLAVNRSAEWAQWDDDLLKLELQDLQLADFDLDLIGFDIAELDAGGTEGLTDPDEVPEVQGQSVSRQGDIWLLGKHRLMCGDSTDAGSVALLMAGEKAKILFTSPPYSNMRAYNGGNLEVDHLVNFIPAYKPYAEYQLVNLGIQIQNREVVQYWDEYIKTAKDAGYKLMAWMVWDKMNVGSIGQQKHFVPTRHEFIFVFGEAAEKLNKTIAKKEENINIRKLRTHRAFDGTMITSTPGDTSNPNKTIESIVSISTNQDRFKDHPAPFPVGLPTEFIKAFTKEGDIVAEPFSGSGTTIIAAEQNGRSCYGMELSPQYVDCAIHRWQDFTGDAATLEGDGRTFAEIAAERG